MSDTKRITPDCRNCNGSGRVGTLDVNQPCPVCGGTGTVAPTRQEDK